MEYSVTQNTVFLTAASILQKIISFGYFTLVARLIGVENTGQYFFAIAFTSIFTVIADFGLSPVMIRELAKAGPEPKTAINTVFTTKLLFSIATLGLLAIVVQLLGYGPELRLLIYISGLTMFFDNIQTVFYSTFRAHGNLRYESTLIVISQFLTMIIGTAALFLHAPLVFLILAYTIPSALLAVYGFWAVARKYGIVIRLQIHRALIKTWLAWSWPFALAAILSRLYAYTDSIVISKMLPAEHLGWWSVPYKITFAFQFIAVSVSTSLYPAASALAGDSSLLRSKFAQAWHYLFLVALPLSLGLIAVAQPVIVRVFGKSYAPSAPILQILLLSLIFGFLSFITGAMLNATNRQRTQTALMASALVSNIILNFVLLPRFGLEGAAFAALIGNIILALGGYIACTQFLRLPHGQILAAFLKTLLAAGVMALLAHWLLAFLPLLAVIALAGFLYGVFAFMTGAITVEHILSVKQKLVSTP